MKLYALTILSWIVLSSCSGEKTAYEYLESAREYQQAGRFPAALIETRNSARLDPDNGSVRAMIGELELLTGDPESSEAALLKALELGIHESELLGLLSQAYVQQEKYVAVLELDESGLSTSDRATVLSNQAIAHLALGELTAAKAAATKALDAEQNSPAALTVNAQIKAIENNFPEARQYLSKATASSQKHSEAWELLGDIEAEENNVDDAITAYSKAIDYAPRPLVALLKRAQLYLNLKQFDNVNADLAQLKKAGARLPIMNLMKTEILFAEGNLLDAQTELEAALKLDPESAAVARSLSLTHLLLGNSGQAEQYAKQYQISTDGTDARVLLAAIRLQQGRYDLAVEALIPLVETDRLDVLGSQILATAYLKQNEADKAVTTMLGLHARLSGEGVTTYPDLALMRKPSQVLSKALQVDSEITEENASEQYLSDDHLVLVGIVTNLAEGETVAAMTTLTQLAESEKDNPVVHSLRGRIHLANKDLDAARISFQTAVDSAETPDSSSLMLALMDLNTGAVEPARAQLLQALDRASESSKLQLLLTLAGLEESAGDKGQMLYWLQQASQSYTDAYLPAIALANYYTRALEHEKVIKTLEAFSDDIYRTRRSVSLLAQAHTALNQSDEAIELLTPMIQREPDFANWRYLRARAHASTGSNAESLLDLEQALKIDPDHAPSLLAKISFDIEEGNLETASSQLNRLQTQMPESPAVKTLLSRLESRSALANSTTPTAIPDSTESVLNLARSLWTQNRQEEALTSLENWLTEHENDVSVILALGNTYASLDRSDEANKMFESALKYSPDNFVALNNLAWQLREQDPEAAVTYATTALEQQPSNTSILDTLSVIYLGQGNLEAAENILRTIQSLNVTEPSILLNNARIEVALGNKNAAKTILKPLIEDSIQFPEAEDALTLYNSL